MTTYPDDHVVFHTTTGQRRFTLNQLGLEWPAQPLLTDPSAAIEGVVLWRKVSESPITDELRAASDHWARAVHYTPLVSSADDGEPTEGQAGSSA